MLNFLRSHEAVNKKMGIESPETKNPYQQELLAKINSQKFIINQLVGVIEECNGMLLDAAANSDEADEFLSISKILVRAVVGVAKA